MGGGGGRFIIADIGGGGGARDGAIVPREGGGGIAVVGGSGASGGLSCSGTFGPIRSRSSEGLKGNIRTGNKYLHVWPLSLRRTRYQQGSM